MIRISDLPLSLDADLPELRAKAARMLRISPDAVQALTLVRQSIDARKKSDVHYVCTVDLSAEDEAYLVLSLIHI